MRLAKSSKRLVARKFNLGTRPAPASITITTTFILRRGAVSFPLRQDGCPAPNLPHLRPSQFIPARRNAPFSSRFRSSLSLFYWYVLCHFRRGQCRTAGAV